MRFKKIYDLIASKPRYNMGESTYRYYHVESFEADKQVIFPSAAFAIIEFDKQQSPVSL